METKNDLMEYVAKLSRMVRRRPAGEHHISRGGHRLLGIVLENDGIRTTDLAEKTDIRPASLTDVLKRLDDDGYIRREKDQNDSRVIRVYATETAREEHKRRELERQNQNERLRAYLTDEETAVFCEVCDKLCAFFEKEYPQESCSLEADGKGRHLKKGHKKEGHHGDHEKDHGKKHGRDRRGQHDEETHE